MGEADGAWKLLAWLEETQPTIDLESPDPFPSFMLKLLLEERGDLRLTSCSYVPEFSIRNRFADSKPVTLCSLLAHHSGMPSDVFKGMWVDLPPMLRRKTIRLMRHSQRLRQW